MMQTSRAEARSNGGSDLHNLPRALAVLGAQGDGKVFLLCRITSDLKDRFNAGKIIKDLSAVVDGRGGGRRDMAEGGGTNVSELSNALSKAYELIAEQSLG